MDVNTFQAKINAKKDRKSVLRNSVDIPNSNKNILNNSDIVNNNVDNSYMKIEDESKNIKIIKNNSVIKLKPSKQLASLKKMVSWHKFFFSPNLVKIQFRF